MKQFNLYKAEANGTKTFIGCIHADYYKELEHVFLFYIGNKTTACIYNIYVEECIEE